VPDAAAAFARLTWLGAKEHRAVIEVGKGILVGSVYDPFSNVLGIIENPYFKIAMDHEPHATTT
jgi:hypothetical protein